MAVDYTLPAGSTVFDFLDQFQIACNNGHVLTALGVCTSSYTQYGSSLGAVTIRYSSANITKISFSDFFSNFPGYTLLSGSNGSVSYSVQLLLTYLFNNSGSIRSLFFSDVPILIFTSPCLASIISDSYQRHLILSAFFENDEIKKIYCYAGLNLAGIYSVSLFKENATAVTTNFIKGDKGDTGPAGPAGDSGSIDLTPVVEKLTLISDKLTAIDENLSAVAGSAVTTVDVVGVNI